MTIQEAIASADEAKCRAVLSHVLEEYGKPAFGALPKKEVDLLILEALVQVGHLDFEPSLYHLIQRLKVTRSKARTLLYERDLRRLGNEQLNDLLRATLSQPLVLKQGEIFCLEIENPLVIDHLKDKLKHLGHATDGSFSPSLVKLSTDAFSSLIAGSAPSSKHSEIKAALVKAGAPDGSFGGVIKGVLVKLGGRFADSAGEALAENISEYLGPILSGLTKEVSSRFSGLYRDPA